MKAIFCNQRNGRHRKSLCPGDPQDPAQYLKEVLVPGASLPGYPHIKGISVLLFLLGYSGDCACCAPAVYLLCACCNNAKLGILRQHFPSLSLQISSLSFLCVTELIPRASTKLTHDDSFSLSSVRRTRGFGFKMKVPRPSVSWQ